MSQPEPGGATADPDVIDLRKTVDELQSRLAASEARFHNVVERGSDGVLVVDAAGIIRYTNPGAVAMLARPASDLVGTYVGFPVVSGEVTEVELVRPGRQGFVAEMRVVDCEWEGQQCRLALLRDVTERRRSELELAEQATHDPLTRLPNRYLLEDRLVQALARMDRRAGSLAVFVADIDDFKVVNDRFGHLVGDEVLVRTAGRMKSLLRPTDTAARLGGDEFVLLCESMGADAAEQLVGRLTDAFEQPMSLATGEISVSLSVGYAVTSDPRSTSVGLLTAADRSMYHCKERRRSSTEPTRR